MYSHVKRFLGVLAFAPLAVADICSQIEAAGIAVESKFSFGYSSTLQNYWSVACGDLKPTCIATPSGAKEMSHIIKELYNYDGLFAVKSGGHMPNNGFASIQDGLLISTENMKQVYYNEDDETAIIGPGLTWEDAQKSLDKIHPGRTLVGGRLGGVGVGGYMLGGKCLGGRRTR